MESNEKNSPYLRRLECVADWLHAFLRAPLGHSLCTVAILFVTSGNVWALCKPGDPTGYFEGTAKGAQVGDLDISLNLRCAGGRYEGELITPVGNFPILDGKFETGQLHLEFNVGGKGEIQARGEVEHIEGTFVLPDATGAIDLRRMEEPRPPINADAILNLPIERWREDLEFVAREIPKRHANAFHHTSRDKFGVLIKDLSTRLDHLDGDGMYVGIDRIANLIGDAHTYVELPNNRAAFPLAIARFGKEYRVTRVAPGLEKALGSRVVNVQDTPVARAHDILLQLTPQAETRVLADARIGGFLAMGMLLHGTGIIPTRDSARYKLVDDAGKQFTIEVHASPTNGADIQWIWAYKERPLYRERPGETFWATYLADSRTVYCSFRGYDNLGKNAADLLKLVDERQPDKVVIDMRQNGGGDYNEGLKYLIGPIRSIPMINRKGHLFVIIGPNTFSAAMSNAAQFRSQTAAILVGQTIGEKPNSYQEARQMILPHSHLTVRYSTRYYRFSERGKNVVAPDQEITSG